MRYVPVDPSEAVILFADLQAGIIERSATNAPAHLRSCVSALARLARLFQIPVVVTAAPSQDGEARVTPEIAGALGELPPHVRNTTDAFLHPATRDAISATGRRTLLVAGVATEVIVQHSALSASESGLAVQVVVDACGGLSARTEDAAFRRLVHAGVALTSVASIAGELAGDLGRALGQQAAGILFEVASP
jgi:nicotinamidase-related amidase